MWIVTDKYKLGYAEGRGSRYNYYVCSMFDYYVYHVIF